MPAPYGLEIIDNCAHLRVEKRRLLLPTVLRRP